MPDSSMTAALSGRWESTTRFGGKGAIAEVMPPAPVESVISRRPPTLRRIVFSPPDANRRFGVVANRSLPLSTRHIRLSPSHVKIRPDRSSIVDRNGSGPFASSGRSNTSGLRATRNSPCCHVATQMLSWRSRNNFP
jgi:hypothetical protein